MLHPERVILLLEHADAELRRLAIEYFAYGHDSAPLTQADAFRVADRYGIEEADILFGKFPRLPPSDDARRLRDLANEETLPSGVFRAIAWLEAGLTEEWVSDPGASKLNADVRELIHQRQRLKGRSARELWRMHEELFVQNKGGNPPMSSSPGFEAVRAELRQSAADAGALAVMTLREASRFWPRGDRPAADEEAALSWLCDTPHPDALPFLLRAALGPERRLSDFADPALMRCGEVAFEPILAAYRAREDGACAYSIGCFRLAAVEETLTELLLREKDDYERTSIGMALCMLFPTNALPHILDVVARGAWLPDMEPLDHFLVMAARAADWDPPELQAIREQVQLQDESAEEPSGIHPIPRP